MNTMETQLMEGVEIASEAVERHRVFERVQTLEQLRVFMEHHVFAVWDFMSLLKSLQHAVAPSGWPWLPPAHGDLVRLVNEIVVAEESDALPEPDASGRSYTSHFELYLMAMREVGADTGCVERFLARVREKGLAAGLADPGVPEPSRAFMRDTFALIEEGGAHRVAAAFAFGRENAIPGMFETLLGGLGIGEDRAPVFHYYLKRHTQIDGEEHGPAAVRLVSALSGGGDEKMREAREAALAALASRKRLWDSMERELEGAR